MWVGSGKTMSCSEKTLFAKREVNAACSLTREITSTRSSPAMAAWNSERFSPYCHQYRR